MKSTSRASSPAGDEQVVDGLEEREVAVDLDREVVVCELRPPTEQPARPLRVLEALQAGFGQRVDGDDGGARSLGRLQRGQHPRVIGARVLAHHDDQVGGDEIGDVDRALADADRLDQRHPARLVAHVRTVGQVVGAEAPGEQLVQERGFVARPTRRVERRGVRRGQRPQLRGDQLERRRPGDRFVVRGPRPLDHRFGEPALPAEPVLRAPTEFGDRVFGEERRRDPRRRRLLGDRLHTVLAELRDVGVSRLGPGAARDSRSHRVGSTPATSTASGASPSVRRPGGATPRPPWPRRPNPWAVRRCRRTPRAGQRPSSRTSVGVDRVFQQCNPARRPFVAVTSDRSDCAHDVIDRLPPHQHAAGRLDVARRFRRQGDPRRQCRVEVRTHPAVHGPRSAARAVQGPRLHRGRDSRATSSVPRSPARPRRSRRSVRPPTASRFR